MPKKYQILKPKWSLTVNQTFEVLTDYAVIIENECIHSLAPNDELTQLPFFEQSQVIELPNHLLMPGLVNAHTHASMSLLRGFADDLPLMDWLEHHIWPAETNWVDPRFIADGFRLAAVEMMRSGTTCLNDMYFYPDVVAREAQKLGLRTVVGLIILDLPTVWAKDANEYLHKALAVHDEVQAYPLVTSTLAPHAPYTVCDQSMEQIAMYSSELDVPIHCHIHETAFEVALAEQQTGMRPLERLDQLNILGPNLIAVHMTELNAFEIERIAEVGVHIAHCPHSNLKLASGMCPVAQLQDAAINVCLGTDGAASNNNLDLFAEMKTAALLTKGVSGDAAACNARQAIEMATINGAKAIGLDNIIGSIEVGKQADLIAIDLSQSNTQPVYDPVAHLVYATNSRQVSDMWINGKRQMQEHRLLHIDDSDIHQRAQAWASKIGSTT